MPPKWQWLNGWCIAWVGFSFGSAETAQTRFVAKRLFPKPGQEPLRKMAAERIAANDPATYRRLLFAIRAFNATDRLSEITYPTLVIAGDRDTTMPLRAKTICTAGYACPQPDCDYFGNADPTFHALIGNGQRASDGIHLTLSGRKIDPFFPSFDYPSRITIL